MRRKDREMNEEFALEIIDKSTYGVLGACLDNIPYTIPLSVVRDEKVLYFHSATSGKKFDYLKDGSEVSLSFVGQVKVPNLYTREEIQASDCQEKLLKNVYTQEFESCHVEGKVYQVRDIDEKKKALKLLVEKFTPEFKDMADKVIEKAHSYTAVFKVELISISAKRKKYGPDKVELKGNKN